MKSDLKPPGTKRLKVKYDIPLSNSAFKFNFRRFSVGFIAGRARSGGTWQGPEPLVPSLSAHSIPVHPCTPAASSSLAVHSFPWKLRGIAASAFTLSRNS